MRRSGRFLAAIVTALGCAWVPATSATACSCAWTELPEAIDEADLAVVATLVQTIGDDPDGLEPMTMTWSVERSRDTLDRSRLTVTGWRENGANCGVTFEVGERWLLLAYRAEHGLETNGCLRNTRLADVPPEDGAVIEELVARPVASSDPEPPDAATLPGPIVLGVGAAIAIALVSFLAFRRGGVAA